MNVDALRVSREALGMTQTDLAKASGLPQSDISRWERGIRQPSDVQLEALSRTLGVPTAFLANDTRLTRPVHRTQRSETKRTERMVNGRLELARLAASNLLADINVDTPYGFPTADQPAPPDPEDAAESLRRVWRMPAGPVENLTQLIESAGSVVLAVDFGSDNILAAYTSMRGDQRWCFLNTRASDGARARFSLAHELGHAVLHWDRFDAPTGRDAEREAHKFAAAFLMPRDELLADLGRSRLALDDLVVVRQRWGVSVQAIVMRASDVGLITSDQKSRMFQQINARGWRKSEPGLVPLEAPTVLRDAISIQRNEHRYTDDELAELAGLSLNRLSDLLPHNFARPDVRPRLRLAT